MNRVPVIVALNNVRSLHNVGAIFRSADAVNIERVVLGGLTPVPPRHEIEKTALGATKSVAWEYVENLPSYLRKAKKEGYCIAALEQTENATSIFTARPPLPLILIVGHEREGVEQNILALCDAVYNIPMHGSSAHSLNVSTSTTVALYALRNHCEKMAN